MEGHHHVLGHGDVRLSSASELPGHGELHDLFLRVHDYRHWLPTVSAMESDRVEAPAARMIPAVGSKV